MLKLKGEDHIGPFIADVNQRLGNGEVFTDNRRNFQVKAEALLKCKNDIEVYRKAGDITSQLKKKPVEALPILPTLKFVPASDGEGDSLLGTTDTGGERCRCGAEWERMGWCPHNPRRNPRRRRDSDS